MLAASITQSIAGAVAAVSVVAGVVYLVSYVISGRKEVGAEIEVAPNRKPYYDDDELETRKLDRTLALGLGCLIVVGVGLPLYWLAEPGRQEHAIVKFDELFASRGHITYLPPTEGANSFGCQNCHGPDGVGGVAPFTLVDPATGEARQVQWQAPALNTVLLRFTEEEVTGIITYGRANTPMPAWGTAGGGPMNTQQIRDLVEYLKSIQLTPEEAQAQAVADHGDTDGASLFAAFCSRCHTQGASFGEPARVGGGAFGPSLVDGTTLRQFPDPADHADFVTEGSEYGQGYGTRGIGSGRMPGFGQMLTEAQIQAIVDYERGL